MPSSSSSESAYGIVSLSVSESVMLAVSEDVSLPVMSRVSSFVETRHQLEQGLV